MTIVKVQRNTIPSGFGQGIDAVGYFLNGDPYNFAMAEEILMQHFSSIQKQCRMKTKKPRPDITVYSNGNRVYDDEGNRLSRSGRYEASSGISTDPKVAEATRQALVPEYYEACAFRAVLTQPWDHIGELTPLYVGCKHPVFRKENDGECLGQCAIAGQKYGDGQPKFLHTNDGSLDYTAEYQRQLKQI